MLIKFNWSPISTPWSLTCHSARILLPLVIFIDRPPNTKITMSFILTDGVVICKSTDIGSTVKEKQVIHENCK